MGSTLHQDVWSQDAFAADIVQALPFLAKDLPLDTLRRKLLKRVNLLYYNSHKPDLRIHVLDRVIVRDCARALTSILHPRSERLAGFSCLQAIQDAARNIRRPDLSDSFWADIIHIFWGVLGRVRLHEHDSLEVPPTLKGRDAARVRSDQLDDLGLAFNKAMGRFPSGLKEEVVALRRQRQEEILRALSATLADWDDWRWQLRHILRNEEDLCRVVRLKDEEREAIRRALAIGLPFGVTPYYASLFANHGEFDDRAIRAQVIPPLEYVEAVESAKDRSALDFMREGDTSPVDLVTRRYATICIIKPYNACPQICVYCQRNFEIEGPLAPGAAAPPAKVEEALSWLAQRPAIHEVLITGGDPLVLSDSRLQRLLERLAAIPHIERIRIGTRMIVTMPMRITPRLCQILASFREPGRCEIAVVTHVQSALELTPDLVQAVERLRLHGIPVYNQMVFTFHVSRRFEAANLRRLLRLCGIDPYYTFNTKGKEETKAYRVPIARLLQEQKEEARLLPGLARTDIAVYNLPAIGKNELTSWQHRDLISVLPDGSRLYEFHPWEKKIARQRTYLAKDVPILDYLRRLEELGEDPSDYESIWYYF